MQPRVLALVLSLLPVLVANAAYLLSAFNGFVPWCIPYLDGCTTISQAARSGDSIHIFRVPMITYAVLLIVFWLYSKHWLERLHGQSTKLAALIMWLGIISALALMVYVDFLGSSGEINRFMRRHGVMLFFTLTPLAQLLLLQQHYAILRKSPAAAINVSALRFQLLVLVLMLVIAIISIILAYTQSKSYESENIVEWTFSLLLSLYFAGMVFIWKGYKLAFKHQPFEH